MLQNDKKKIKNVKYAECIRCGRRYEAETELGLCKCGGTLEIQYDYEKMKKEIPREKIEHSSDYSMWRYREMLPVAQGVTVQNMMVGGTPLYRCRMLGEQIGISELYLKDEGRNPTASLKDRASAVGISKARENKKKVVCCASTGNAAASLAGNAAADQLRCVIFVPANISQAKLAQLLIFGAIVFRVDGNYEEAFLLSEQVIERYGWYSRNAGINPFLIEGKKTVAYEICEQLGWQSPDYVAVSVGDGCTIAGIWKGFLDLYELNWIEKLPRLISVQASGCCPVHRSIKEGMVSKAALEGTLADSIAVERPRNREKAVRAMIQSKGLMAEVSDEEILEAMKMMGHSSGVFAEMAGAAALAGVRKLCREGRIEKGKKVVVVVTGNGLKDCSSALKATGQPMEIKPEIQCFDKIAKTLDLC
ncbi:MAG: threonine synthase [Lachnospiraceae bacterium]|nr:threonine synthase [Robinsoniella sp.]MDY3767850.1 threonine synthase [Lachnospiraceae bacterium]